MTLCRFGEYKSEPLLRGHLNMGESGGREKIEVTSRYFTRGGVPFIGVVGEYHFSRGRRADWYRELCKMRAGGVTVVSTYMFWIYHEEVEGEFDFGGDLDVKQFVLDAGRAGLEVILRIGPWCHGECRNGGFPDWLLSEPYRLRDNNDGYMEKVRVWYSKIYEQVRGLLYKDGGNIIGVQLENELTNNAEHLAALKKTAVNVGFDVPIYTVTGWNSVYGAKIPVDEVVPVFGAYADAPWSGSMKSLPPSANYTFTHNRNDSAIGVDIMRDTDRTGWRLPYERYPFATCELGTGIQVTHHRRPIIKPLDTYALSLVKLGCGNNLIGYYMYHGGGHRIGKTTMQESRATGYPNDYPILNYDFQAAVSQYGETREQYGLLCMLHLFVADFGSVLAPMETVLPTKSVSADDGESVRYAMRTDGDGHGFVFVNRHARGVDFTDAKDVVFDTGSVVFPPIDVLRDAAFFMPFGMRLSESVELEYATAQPLCRVRKAYFFAEIPGVEARYNMRDGAEFTARPGLDGVVRIGDVTVVTLTREQAVRARKLSGELYVGCNCDVYECDDEICAVQEGGFEYDKWTGRGFEHVCVEKESAFEAARLEMITTDEPFSPPYAEELELGGERRCAWYALSVSSPCGMAEIELEYDAAQIYADGVLVADNFYYGEPWRVPASLLYGRECYLVASEMRDDFYREF